MGHYDAPFGGIPILFFGDMNQLGPVQKTIIPKNMLIWALKNVQTSRCKQTKCGAAWTSPAKLPMFSNKTKIIAIAQVYNPFLFDLSFAITIHKAQSHTIKQVILDLTEHANHYAKMEFAAVTVAMSQESNSKHICLLSYSKLGTKLT